MREYKRCGMNVGVDGSCCYTKGRSNDRESYFKTNLIEMWQRCVEASLISGNFQSHSVMMNKRPRKEKGQAFPS